MNSIQKIKYKTVEKGDISSYKKRLLDFYNHFFPENSNRLIINNSQVFFTASEGNEIIGACRLLTDFSRNAILFDLIVRKAKRGQGIGKKLTRHAVLYCQKKSIKKLYLMTDPRLNWLKDFYQKIGFSTSDQILMKLKN